jgi:phosphatidate cytidylyltransferase
MLKQRILTALVLAAIFIPALFLLPHAGFTALIGLLVFLLAYEWAGLAPLHGVSRWAYAIGLTALGLPLVLGDPFQGWVLGAAVALWLLLALRLVLGARVPAWLHGRSAKLVLAPLVLWATWFALESIHSLQDGGLWVLATFMVVWVADTAAYFSGRAFGRHKLAPTISPGKTVEGVAGAVVATLLAAWAAHAFEPFSSLPMLPWLLLVFAITLISVVGDLHESQLKREAGVKDSGWILPGHGGMFDRLDSLLAAAPFMAFGLWQMGLMGA